MNNKTITIILVILVITLSILMPGIIKSNQAYNDQACSINGYQSDCKTPLTPQQKCQNYYNEPCTVNGELPEGVTK